MKPIYVFKIGSNVFFNEIDGFIPKDYDELCIMDTFTLKGNVLRAPLKGKDVFFYRNMDKSGFIKDALESKVPMRVGKFLVPEFAKYLNLTIDDLKQLEPLFSQLDEKHLYEKDIYDAYIENSDFTMTKRQRRKAFNSYKRARKCS